MAELSYPEELRYTKDHEWVRKEGELVVIGISAFAQDSLGDVVYVELPEVGDEIVANDSFGVVESTKAVSELIAPVSGKVVERNDSLEDSPETVNSDPYGAGWMIKVEPSDPAAIDQLLDASAYAKFTEEQG